LIREELAREDRPFGLTEEQWQHRRAYLARRLAKLAGESAA
jgi:hypothetical protein